MKKTLWTRNFTLVTLATGLGSAGGIAGSFALSFLVFDETGSTFAAALIIAIQVIPGFIIPLFAAPWMDRLPRKPFLVGGDIINGILYALAGVYLLLCDFSYVGYLFFSLLLASLGAFDELAYNSIYPKLIPEGMEEKGYSVSSMLYPVMKVMMLPLAAKLLEWLGVAWLLIFQGGMALLAAAIESGIRIKEQNRMEGKRFSPKLWWQDIKEAGRYLKKEKGLQSIYSYMAVTNGMGSGYTSVLVAFFRTAPGFTAAMYALFSGAEFIGRTIGGFVHYFSKIPEKKKFGFAFGVYQLYEGMDMSLLWLPYPLMLVNRGLCGFFGINSATMRQAAVQRYLPEELRSRINAFESVLYTGAAGALSLLVGGLGELLSYPLCMTVCAGMAMLVCWLTVWLNRKQVRMVYEKAEAPAEAPTEATTEAQ